MNEQRRRWSRLSQRRPLIRRDVFGVERELLPGGHSGFVLVLGADWLRLDHLVSEAEAVVEPRRVVLRRRRRRKCTEDVAMRHRAKRVSFFFFI